MQADHIGHNQKQGFYIRVHCYSYYTKSNVTGYNRSENTQRYINMYIIYKYSIPIRSSNEKIVFGPFLYKDFLRGQERTKQYRGVKLTGLAPPRRCSVVRV